MTQNWRGNNFMELVIIACVALTGSTLTFFTGFGLATLLTPFMAVFFPPNIAIALVACVHFLNNIFKYLLTRNAINWPIVLRFGVPALFGAALGAWLLKHLPSAVMLSYAIGAKACEITATKLLLGSLMVFFALYESLPYFTKRQFGRESMSWGASR